MSIATFGLYELFWAYKCWQYLVVSRKAKISPGLRAWFSIIFLYDLLKEMRDHVKSQKGPFSVSLSPIGVFLPWLVLTVLSRLPDAFNLIACITFIPLLPAVTYVSEMNRMDGKEGLMNNKFSTVNKVGIGVGLVLLILIVIGLCLPQ
jgi:hypothetical protein